MHCHILGHEERGMMQVLQIGPVTPAQQGGGAAPALTAGSGS